MVVRFTDIIYLMSQMFSYFGAMVYFTNNKVVDTFKRPLFLALFIPASAIAGVIQRVDHNWIGLAFYLDIALCAVVIKTSLKTTLKDTLVSVLFGYFIVSLADGIVIGGSIILKIGISSDYPLNNRTVCVMMLVPILTYLFLKYIPLLNIKNAIKSYQYTVILLMTAASSTFICIYGSYTHQYTFIPGVSNSVVLIIAFAFIIILMLEEMAERSRGEQLYYYETYIPIIDQMIKGVQLTQHSYNNQIMSLTGIIESDMDKDEMRSAIKNLTGQSVNATRADYHFLHLENRLLAGMLYQKVKHAEELGNNIDFTIRKYSCESEMSDFDIVDITGILIDNAIEHSEDGAKDIYVTVGQPIKSESSKYYIKVENAGPVVSEESINNMFKKGHTSKSDKSGHGLGMYILKDKVNKCKGKVTVSNTTRNDVRMIAVEVEV